MYIKIHVKIYDADKFSLLNIKRVRRVPCNYHVLCHHPEMTDTYVGIGKGM